MSKSTISTFQLFALIPDAETARVYLETRLWPNGPVCPSCITSQRYINPMSKTKLAFSPNRGRSPLREDSRNDL